MTYTVQNWHQGTHTNLSISDIGGLRAMDDALVNGELMLGSGDAENIYNTVTGQVLQLTDGSVASPDSTLGPVLKVERTVSIAESAVSGDGADQLAAILGVTVGTDTCQTQPVGVFGAAKNSSADGGGDGIGNDAAGLYGVGRITGSGTGVGIGAFLLGQRDASTGKALGAEIKVRNNGAAGSYSPSGFSNPMGIFLHASGTNDLAVGMALYADTGKWDTGIGFIQNSITTASLRDDSSSTRVFDINGSHTDIFDTQGATISGKLFKISTPGTYTVTNGSADRALNVTGDTLAQGLAVLGTLIGDLQTLGLIS